VNVKASRQVLFATNYVGCYSAYLSQEFEWKYFSNWHLLSISKLLQEISH